MPRPRTSLLALASLFLLALPGCTRNAVTGYPEVTLVSAAREAKVGAEEAAKVERSIGLIRETGIAVYVSKIGARLADHSPRRDVEYRFHIVDMPEPNAFALPGGYVYVSRGLLAYVNSEDELACVMGHEIAHVAARHSARRVTLAAPFALATALPGALIGIVSPTLGKVASLPGALAGGIVLSPYSRSQENAADRVGLEIAANAGWDPGAMTRFLHTLEREEELMRGHPRRPGFFDSHPSTPKRVATTAGLAGEMPRAEPYRVARDHDALLGKLEGLLVGESAAAGVFVDERFLHPDLGFGFSPPAGWKTRNAPEAVIARGEDGLVALQTVGEHSDPVAIAQKAEDEDGVKIVEAVQPLRIAGLAAARAVVDARSSEGRGRLLLTWIAHDGLVYRIAGFAPAHRFDDLRPVFEKAAGSFAPLRSEERATIREKRLVVVRARAGESLKALVERSDGTAWKVEEVAVANALDVDATLRADQPVKIAMWRSALGAQARLSAASR